MGLIFFFGFAVLSNPLKNIKYILTSCWCDIGQQHDVEINTFFIQFNMNQIAKNIFFVSQIFIIIILSINTVYYK